MNSILNKILAKTSSISNQILIVVAALYILLITIITTFQMINEFKYEKDKVEDELKYIANSSRPSFSHALWEINLPQITSLASGALEQSVLVGVQVFDNKEKILAQMGQTHHIKDKKYLLKNTKEIQSNEKNLFWITLKLDWLRDKKSFDVGSVVLYSSTEVVWDRVKYGFLLILLSALAQIVVFSFLFKKVFDRMLKTPLTTLIQTTDKINLNNIRDIEKLDLQTFGNNELKILDKSLKDMVQKLLDEQKKREELFENHQQFLEKEVKRRTQELSDKETLYKTTIESINNGILVVDLEGKITHSNERFRQMWNIPKKLVDSKDDQVLQHFVLNQLKDPQAFIDKVKTLENSNDSSLDVIEFEDGRIFERFSQAMIKDGINVGRVWSFDDISESKRTEQALIKSETQLKMITDNAPASIAYVDMKTYEYLHVNQRFCDTYGKQKVDIVGHHIRDIIGQKNYEFALPYIKEAKTGKSVSYVNSFPLVHGVRWINVNYTPDFDDHGNVRALFVMSHDITDHIKAEEELKKARDEAQRANKAKSEFIANMSHEIRTPLNAVIGFSELLEQTTIDKKQQNYLESIHAGGKALLNLINDILDLSKIEAGKMSIKMETLDIRQVMKDIEQIFAFSVKEKGLKFNLIINEQIPKYIVFDEIRLRQILFNLVGNAIKFTHKGIIEIDVDMKSKSRDKIDELIIEVKDSGIGIPKDEQEKIFDSFEQQKGQSNRIYGGTGLGLTITKKLVELLGGKIALYSTPNIGTSFFIHLYYIDISTKAPEKSNENLNEEIIFENANILIVDDIESNRELVKNLLANKNLNLFEASDGIEAIQKAKEITPSLILMDIRMSNMDGIDATLKIKEDPKLKNIPVIALTTRNQAEKYSDIFENILEKPITQNILINELKRHLIYKTIEKKKPILQSDITIDDKIVSKIMNDELKILLNKIKDSGEFEDIELFANTLKDIAKDMDLEILDNYANTIINAVDNFDVKKIEELLKFFKNIH